LTDGERRKVEGLLTADETNAFLRFATHDQRHALEVLARLERATTGAPRPVLRAALLHDIGKVDSGLSIGARVLATIAGARTERFARYADHEALGATLLARIGSDPLTVALVRGDDIEPWSTHLRDADRV
jgi:response regulator RpfG family c-di-GMP phosphodiesterase